MTKPFRPRKPEPSNVRGICVLCGERPQTPKGGGRYRSICRRCYKLEYRDSVVDNRKEAIRRHPYKAHRGEVCEDCGFVPVHPCQLDVDHVDGDKANDDPSNLRTLCANCHRLKTFRNRDNGPPRLADR